MTADPAEIATKLTPEAWLIRRIRAGIDGGEVYYPHMFKSEDAANAAAVRLSNSWQLCQAFPVVSLGLVRAILEEQDNAE